MSDTLVILPLPDGDWAAFELDALKAAKARARELGLGPPPAVAETATQERLVDSERLGELWDVHSTTVESLAARGAIPSIRIGRSLRFEPSAATAALKK